MRFAVSTFISVLGLSLAAVRAVMEDVPHTALCTRNAQVLLKVERGHCGCGMPIGAPTTMYHECQGPRCRASTKRIRIHSGVCLDEGPDCAPVDVVPTMTENEVPLTLDAWRAGESTKLVSAAQTVADWRPGTPPHELIGSELGDTSASFTSPTKYGKWESDPEYWHSKNCRVRSPLLEVKEGQCHQRHCRASGRRYARIICVSCRTSHPLSYTAFKCQFCRVPAPVPPQQYDDWLDWAEWLEKKSFLLPKSPLDSPASPAILLSPGSD